MSTARPRRIDARNPVAGTPSSGTRRAGRKDPRHDREAFDPLEAIAPTTDCRIVLPGNAPLFRQHDVGETGDVSDGRVWGRADPVAPFLLAEPEMLVEDAKQPMRTGPSRLDVQFVEQAVMETRGRNRARDPVRKGEPLTDLAEQRRVVTRIPGAGRIIFGAM